MRHLRVLLLAAALLPSLAAAANLYRLDTRFTDDRGRSVRLADWKGRQAIVTMEYSDCRFSCSTTLSGLKAAQAVADAGGKSFDIIVISVDPKHDTPASWTRYRRERELTRANWHFLTAADEAGTRAVARLLGIDYWSEGDQIVHDYRLLRIDANGEVRRVVDRYDADMNRFVE